MPFAINPAPIVDSNERRINYRMDIGLIGILAIVIIVAMTTGKKN